MYSSLLFANIEAHTVKDIIRTEVKALYNGWYNYIGQNKNSELYNTWLIGSNLKNISKETTRKVIGVSRLLVLSMDEVLVTWWRRVLGEENIRRMEKFVDLCS